MKFITGPRVHNYDFRTLQASKKQAVLRNYRYKCVYCGGRAGTVDHVIPWSYLHDNSFPNLVAACRSCNSIASDRVFDSFAEKYWYIRDRREQLGERLENGRSHLKAGIGCCRCRQPFRQRENGATFFLCSTCAFEVSREVPQLIKNPSVVRKKKPSKAMRNAWEKSRQRAALRAEAKKPPKPKTFSELIALKLQEAQATADAILQSEQI